MYHCTTTTTHIHTHTHTNTNTHKHKHTHTQAVPAINALLRTSFEISTSRPDGPAQSLPLHRAVLDAVIARDPPRFRALMPYGAGLKASYCSVVLYHAAAGSIPGIWVPFAWADVVFLALFLAAWRATAAESAAR